MLSIFSIFPFLFFSILVCADNEIPKTTLYQSSSSIEWFVFDRLNPGEVLIKEGSKLVRLHIKNTEVLGRYEDRCGLKSSLWDRLEWANPFLVSMGGTCILNESTKTFERLGDHPIPKNAFSISFLSKDATQYYFLINSRPFNSLGFLYLKTVDPKGKPTVKILSDEVPGYSGAMARDTKDKNGAQNFFYTEATGDSSNHLHQLSVASLEGLVKSGETKKFPELSQKVGNFSGISVWMSVSGSHLLYGEEKSAYLVDRKDFKRTELINIKDCKYASINQNDLILFCGLNNFSSIKLSDAIAQ